MTKQIPNKILFIELKNKCKPVIRIILKPGNSLKKFIQKLKTRGHLGGSVR